MISGIDPLLFLFPHLFSEVCVRWDTIFCDTPSGLSIQTWYKTGSGTFRYVLKALINNSRPRKARATHIQDILKSWHGQKTKLWIFNLAIEFWHIVQKCSESKHHLLKYPGICHAALVVAFFHRCDHPLRCSKQRD
jgi:hypothetical protein